MKKTCYCAFAIVCMLLAGCAVTPQEYKPESTVANTYSTAVSDTDLPSNTNSDVISDNNEKDFAEKLAAKWLEKWSSEERDMMLPQVSIFTAKLSESELLTFFVYPTYKTNSAVCYLLEADKITELYELPCGWKFEVMHNGTDTILHIVYVLPGSELDSAENIVSDNEITDVYYLLSTSGAECILNIGRQEIAGKSVRYFVYDSNYDAIDVSEDDFETQQAAIVSGYSIVQEVNLDNNGDYVNDDYCSFADNKGELISYIESKLS